MDGEACPYCSGDEVWGDCDGLRVGIEPGMYSNVSIECELRVGGTTRLLSERDHFDYCPHCGRRLEGREPW